MKMIANLALLFIIAFLQIKIFAIEKIEGVVKSVLDNEIIVEINSYNEPNIGDKVEISDEVPELGKVALIGDFEVSKTTPNLISVVGKGTEIGTPQSGYSVIIYSTNEIRKEDLETGHEFFSPHVDESIKYNSEEVTTIVNQETNGGFHKVWADFDIVQNGQKGMLIHTYFNIINFQNIPLTHQITFYDNESNPLIDLNNNYGDEKGNVAATIAITPNYKDTIYQDLQTFIPYDELHLSIGRHDLIYKVKVFNHIDINSSVIQSIDNYFYYSLNEIENTKNGEIEQIWVDHNVMLKSVKGMLIHIKFNVKKFKDNKCALNIYFHDNQNNPLKDFNKAYMSSTGNVAVHEDFIPIYDESFFNDFKLFMPYNELHMAKGNYQLMFIVKLYNYELQKMFAESQCSYFDFNS